MNQEMKAHPKDQHVMVVEKLDITSTSAQRGRCSKEVTLPPPMARLEGDIPDGKDITNDPDIPQVRNLCTTGWRGIPEAL